MDVRRLGYIGIDVADMGAWRRYAEVLGTMVVSSGSDGQFRIKIDDRPYRIVVQQADAVEGLAFAGWELRDAAALEQAVAELVAADHVVEQSTGEQRAARQVRRPGSHH